MSTIDIRDEQGHDLPDDKLPHLVRLLTCLLGEEYAIRVMQREVDAAHRLVDDPTFYASERDDRRGQTIDVPIYLHTRRVHRTIRPWGPHNRN
jgi:hypothetical protein